MPDIILKYGQMLPHLINLLKNSAQVLFPQRGLAGLFEFAILICSIVTFITN